MYATFMLIAHLKRLLLGSFNFTSN